MANMLIHKGIYTKISACCALAFGLAVFTISVTNLQAQTISADSGRSTAPRTIDRATELGQGERGRLRSAPTRQAVTAEEIDTFGFDDVDSRTKKALQRYRKTQRRYGFERAGRGVDVEAGYEAAGKNSIRR